MCPGAHVGQANGVEWRTSCSCAHMKLSVIIVNYNVRAYLEQCLRTVFTALEGVDGEVFVVDNQSTDGSVEMVREEFPQVRLIANKENVGFSRANNQAILQSRAEHVVLLNPDTVVGENVFRDVLAFLDADPKAGGLGVKMIDGAGHFLPESKRGLPTPAVAFYKIIGLTRLFPRSRVFGRYHLGHLPEDRPARIEILSGACMFLRKKTLDEVGLLDESFFMYGEDIDLSYRITLGGYENWYFPQARIIHYKGESTKKSSVNYVFVFYNAMAIFAKKHFTRRRTDPFGLVINGSIYLSAAGAIVARFLRRALLPIVDLILLFGALLLGARTLPGGAPEAGLVGGLFALGAVHLLAFFGLFGGYDLPVRLKNIAIASAAAAAWTFLVHWISDPRDDLGERTAWALLAGAVLATVGCLSRLLLHMLRVKPFSLRMLDRKRVLSIGSAEENRNALALLWQTHFGLGRQRQFSAEQAEAPDAVDRIRTELRRHDIDEVVFCASDLAWSRIIGLMEALRRTGAVFKIAQPGRNLIIGSSSIETLQDLHIMERHSVTSSGSRRSKRIVDVVISVCLLAALPVTLVFVRDRRAFLSNWWNVLMGRLSWVGYHPGPGRTLKLPAIRPGVIDPVSVQGLDPAPLTVDRVNITYAKDYRAWTDVRLVWKGVRALGG